MPFRSHIPVAYALPLFVLRVAELVLAIVVLGLLAYLGYWYDNYYGGYTSVYSGAIGVGLFTVCVTLIVNTYYLVAALRLHKIYHPIALIALDAFLVLFWLITWALCAKSTSDSHAYDNYYSSPTYTTYNGHTYECYSDGTCTFISKRATSKTTSQWTSVFAAALTFSIIEWFMFIATLALILLGYLRSRRTGGPAVAASPAAAGVEKNTAISAQPPVVQTYDQQYSQPQYTQPTHYTEGSELPQQESAATHAHPVTGTQPGQTLASSEVTPQPAAAHPTQTVPTQ